MRGMTDEEKATEARLREQLRRENEALNNMRGSGFTREEIDAARAKADETNKALQDFLNTLLVTTPGLDLFKGTGSSSERTGTTKGIAQASQDSIDELNGRMTAVQGHTFRIADGMDILKANSSAILNNVVLIKGHTESMQADMKAVKSGIETINQKGITLKN